MSLNLPRGALAVLRSALASSAWRGQRGDAQLAAALLSAPAFVLSDQLGPSSSGSTAVQIAWDMDRVTLPCNDEQLAMMRRCIALLIEARAITAGPNLKRLTAALGIG